jgi:hypothetical protein
MGRDLQEQTEITEIQKLTRKDLTADYTDEVPDFIAACEQFGLLQFKERGERREESVTQIRARVWGALRKSAVDASLWRCRR